MMQVVVYSGYGQVPSEVTCDRPGQKVYRCARCGETIKDGCVLIDPSWSCPQCGGPIELVGVIGGWGEQGLGGYGYVEERSESELEREEYYEERLDRAASAAEEAAYQANINAALAEQAQAFNQTIMVGFVGAGAVAVLTWAVSQAIQGSKKR